MGSDTSAVVHGSAACSTSATNASPAGTYGTTCSTLGLSSANYSFTAVAGHLTITLARPAISYTGKMSYRHDDEARFSAKLRSTVTAIAISGRKLKFTLGSGKKKQSCAAVTNKSGVASCQLQNVNGKAGTRTLTVAFAGDPRGQNYDYSAATFTRTIKIK